jgi:hypothetical protein
MGSESSINSLLGESKFFRRGYDGGTDFLNIKINFKPEPNLKLQYLIITSIFLRIDHTLPPVIAYGESIGIFLIKIGGKKYLTISEGVQREIKSCTPKVIIKF